MLTHARQDMSAIRKCLARLDLLPSIIVGSALSINTSQREMKREHFISKAIVPMHDRGFLQPLMSCHDLGPRPEYLRLANVWPSGAALADLHAEWLTAECGGADNLKRQFQRWPRLRNRPKQILSTTPKPSAAANGSGQVPAHARRPDLLGPPMSRERSAMSEPQSLKIETGSIGQDKILCGVILKPKLSVLRALKIDTRYST